MKYIVSISIIFFILGCSNKEELKSIALIPQQDIVKELYVEPKPQVQVEKIIEVEDANYVLQDLLTIPQNIEEYTSYIKDNTYMIAKEYEKAYFSVWNMKRPAETLEDILWPFKSFKSVSSYGENFLPIKQSFFDSMYKESNFGSYLEVSKKGLILKYTNIRAFPTSRPLLGDPSLAGEGFPFDYLQNSSINANTPVFISHYSNDKQWVFIFSRFTYGWVKNEDVIAIKEQYINIWKNAKQVHIIKEGIPLFTQNSEALYDTRIGMMFALIKEDSHNYIVLTVSKFKDNEAMYHKTEISKKHAKLEQLALSKDNINMIVNEVSKTNYGWGGVYGQRDCSSTLMDIYAPFGIALPRNSSKQSQIGLVIDLSNLSNKEKLEKIKKKAIPFETLLYKRGHIVMYVGVYKDDVIVFHNTWGIKTKDAKGEGRFIIGKSIFSTLTVGSELSNYNEDEEILRNIRSMNIITR